MRKILIVLGVIAAVLLGVFVFATGGSPRRPCPGWVTAQLIAHRGEWAEGAERPENSLAAFEAAVGDGYAIELDVQRTKDGKTVVMHDTELSRMTGEPGELAELTLAELKQRRLKGGEEQIPTLAETLALVRGRTPLFVEIKNEGSVGPLEDDVARQLAEYNGRAAVISFNPFSLGRVAASEPDVLRGQTSSELKGEDLAFYEVFLLKNFLMNWKSRPDFVTYDLNALPRMTTTLQRWRGRPLLAWTATTQAERTDAAKVADAVMADPGGLPK